MELGTPQELLLRMVESLRLVASESKVQLSAFPSFCFAPDEIVETFSCAYSLLWRVVDAGMLSPMQAEAIAQIDRKFSELSSDAHKDFWTLHALGQHSDWDRLRQMASSALDLLGVQKKAPDLYWIKYV